MSDRLNSPAHLYGLVLTGGRSSRMRRDKATLRYHGRTQLDWAMALIHPHVDRAFVSVRADQQNDPDRAKYPQIVDTRTELGPIAGILAAQAQHPDVAWLVVACDLPFLDASTVDHLLHSRATQRPATAYKSAHDGLPEPVCAIYEPSSREAILAYVQSGKDCPRKFLIRSEAHLVDLPNARALENINTPEEYGSAMAKLNSSPQTTHASDSPSGGSASVTTAPGSVKQIKVQYYALLREQAGRSEEALSTAARTPRELYDELKGRYPFTLAPEMLRVAVNAEFGEWSQLLGNGDSIVFIPPVAGG